MAKEPGEIPMCDPLGFFLTWTVYGTWLPGDERGWVAKPGQFEPPDPIRKAAAQDLMTEPACYLKPAQRRVVERTVGEHCATRGWQLHIVRCGAKHVHVVVTAPRRKPKEVLDQLKAWCTRRLKEQQRENAPCSETREKWWTQGGSKRRLYDQASLDAAIRYVLEDQDGPRFGDDTDDDDETHEPRT